MAELAASGLSISSIFQIFNDEAGQVTGCVVQYSGTSAYLDATCRRKHCVAFSIDVWNMRGQNFCKAKCAAQVCDALREVTDAARPNAVALGSDGPDGKGEWPCLSGRHGCFGLVKPQNVPAREGYPPSRQAEVTAQETTTEDYPKQP